MYVCEREKERRRKRKRESEIIIHRTLIIVQNSYRLMYGLFYSLNLFIVYAMKCMSQYIFSLYCFAYWNRTNELKTFRHNYTRKVNNICETQTYVEILICVTYFIYINENYQSNNTK